MKQYPLRHSLACAVLALALGLGLALAPVQAQTPAPTPRNNSITIRVGVQENESAAAQRTRILESYLNPKSGDTSETTPGSPATPSQVVRGFLFAFKDEAAGREDRTLSEGLGRMELKGASNLLTEAQRRDLANNLRTALLGLPLFAPDVVDKRGTTADLVDVTTTTAGSIRLRKTATGGWIFTDDSIQALPQILQLLEEDQPGKAPDLTDAKTILRLGARATLPAWAQHTWAGAAVWQWGSLALGLIIGLPLVLSTLRRLLRRIILLLVGRHGFMPSDQTLNPTLRSAALFCTAWIGYGGLNALEMPPRVTGILTYLFILIGLYGLLGTLWYGLEALGRVYIRRRQLGVGGASDDILVNFVVRAAKILLILVGLAVAGSALGFNITALLAGLGLGGVAFALAAKNTIENLFGTITLLVDRPFRIGDRIRINSVEGVVTKVGLRSTRITTATESAITLPNHQFIGSTIENFGPVPRRIWRTSLVIDPSNPRDRLMKFLEEARSLIRNKSSVISDSVVVQISDFGPRSMSLLITVRIRALDDTAEFAAREEIVLGLTHLLTSHEIKIAPPGT